MDYNCQFCNKSFSTQYTLNYHQRSTRYCLKLQQQNKQIENTTSIITNDTISCEFCNKEFTLKSNLKTHYSSCSSKREHDIRKEITDKYEKQLEELKQLNDKKLEELIQVKNKELELKDKELEELRQSFKEEITEIRYIKKQEMNDLNQRCKDDIERISKLKDKEINELKQTSKEEILLLNFKVEQLENDILKLEKYNIKLENDLKKEVVENKNILLKREEKLTDEIIKRPATVYQDNRQTTSNNNNYNLQFNKLFEALKPRTDEYIKESIKRIKIDDMIYTNDNDIDYNFACNLVNILKDTVFFTDPSRGKLVFKDENGNSARMQAQAYILECIKISKPECIELCRRSLEIVKLREKEFTEEDYAKCAVKISQLSDCINKGKQHSIITEISNSLIKVCDSVSKNVPQITNTTE
jgi:hypothetical protein